MKSFTIFIAFVFITTQIQAQELDELFSLPDLAIVIDIYDDTGNPYSGSTFYIKDTMYQDEKYLEYISEYFGYFYLRIDGEKVLMKESSLNTFERLIFDFGVNVQDQFPPGTFGNFMTIEVEKVYEIEFLDGIKRKAVDLVNLKSQTPYATWIAGIGNEKYGYFKAAGFTSLQLRCISSNLGSIYLEGDFTNEECEKRSCRRLSANFTILDNSFENKVEIQPGSLNYDSISLTFGDGIYFDEFIYQYEYEEPGCYLIEIDYFDVCGNVYSRSAYYNNCVDDLYIEASEQEIRDFAFVNKDEGIAIINNRPHHTSDGGISWDEASYPDIGSSDPNFIAPNLKGNIGLMCIAGNATNYPRVLYSNDGGENWQGVLDEDYYSKSAIASNGYLFVSRHGLKRSKDEGLTWEDIGIYCSCLRKFIFISRQDHLYVVNQFAQGYQVDRSIDYGDSWATIFNSPEVIRSVHFIDADNGLIATSNELLRTDDAGISWSSVLKFDTSFGFSKLSFYDEQNGMTIYANKVYRTTDSGYTWFVEYCGNTYHIENFAQVGIDDIYLKMPFEKMYKRYEDPDFECDDLGTSVNNASEVVRIYPNPTSNTLFIDAPPSADIRYFIYDLSGNIVMQSQVRPNTQIDISMLNSGLFVITIFTDQSTATYKFIVE